MYIKFLNKVHVVDCKTGEIECEDKTQLVTTTEKVLILHYLLGSKIKPISNNMISFKELPDGTNIYYPSFNKRAILPLLKRFEKNQDEFKNAINELNGEMERYGSISATIRIFPLVPVTYIIWEGDEEVSGRATILFDDTITSYLPGEDIVLAASFGVYKMMKIASDFSKGRG